MLKKLDSWIENIEGWALVASLATLMTIAFTQVILRNFFSTALSWGDGLTRALVLWSGLIGASMAVKQNKYINIDTASRILGTKAKRIVRYGIYLFSVVVCFLMGMAAVTFIKMEQEAATQYSMGIDSWIIELIIPVMFFFMAFRFFLKFLSLASGEPLEKQEWE